MKQNLEANKGGWSWNRNINKPILQIDLIGPKRKIGKKFELIQASNLINILNKFFVHIYLEPEFYLI